MLMNHQSLSSFIGAVAEKQHKFGRVILTFTVLGHLDCVLEPTKSAVLYLRCAIEQDGFLDLEDIATECRAVSIAGKTDVRWSA
jgi:hypothetical protein